MFVLSPLGDPDVKFSVVGITFLQSVLSAAEWMWR